jgi:enoyl-CoA hydratase/carnithine racemase
MACDLLVAAENARLGEPEIRIGSGPEALLMPFIIGQRKTRELLMTGDLIDAAEAYRIGLVNQVVPHDELEQAVDAFAERLARVSPDVMAPTKHMLNRAQEASGMLEALQAAVDLQPIINMNSTQMEFLEIVRTEGMDSALRWRDERHSDRSR